MKTLAIALNIALLCVFGYMALKHGLPSADNPGEILWVSLIFATTVVNLVVLRFKPASDWFSLYLRRKALEERKKIDALEAEGKR